MFLCESRGNPSDHNGDSMKSGGTLCVLIVSPCFPHRPFTRASLFAIFGAVAIFLAYVVEYIDTYNYRIRMKSRHVR